MLKITQRSQADLNLMTDKSFELSQPELNGTTFDLLQNKSIKILLIVLLSIAMPLSLWGLAKWTHETALDNLRLQLDSRMKLYSSNIVSELEKYEYLPTILARDPILKSLFQDEKRAAHIDRANRHLSAIRETAEVSAVYVMDRQGKTIAASNWAEEGSFVGKNFQFRPYFKNAMAGKTGHYFALGTTSKIPGYYLSHPIGDSDKITGVVVVKVSVARLEEAWATANEEVVVTDSNGVIIITGHEEWKFRTLKPLSDEKRSALILTRQYSDAKLLPIDMGRENIVDDQTRRIAIRHPLVDAPDAKNWEDIYIRSRSVLGTDWTIHYIFREANLRDDVINTLILAAFAWLVIILSFLYILQRRNMITHRLEFQERHQKTLEEAAIQLEHRVDRRTKALSEANQRLEEEIQERLKAEDDLHMAQDELVQAGKLAALGQMAAGITHEMNQPLTAIRSYSDNATILLERNRLDDVHSNLEQISDLCARLGKISGQLKVFSRKTPSEKEPISLSKVINETLALLESSAKMGNIDIHNAIGETDAMVLGEAIRLEQVLINILRNALDAMTDQDKAAIWISAEQSQTRMSIIIRDNGPGFKKDELDRIFDPFFTTKEVGKGLGLGLSISSRIIQDFGGVLKAHNHEDGGAVFTIELLQASHG
ncbi:putative C4-dicarboxylate transport sensor protein DctB [Candidatus Terasakiella magnetica]|uniref:C4-dicarboxylate transport sensor protein DctB n=1 Tax=Candidatus Terasakiella magnetica TaxID=1867952 RepID=A0A1C3RI65_9PROT|nr:ATP-binding protein [Candidatus Terasakiella magnetica]SCA56960.1 putative C4-dicarboxylate transport sensor protein DctB [Candidatus Terasakiella magnetica]